MDAWYAVQVRAALILLVACSSQRPVSSPATPAAPVVANHTRTCTSAAAGLERATIGVRDPDAEVLEPMRSLCADDAWPTQAVDCFAQMKQDDLGRCAGMLSQKSRDALFAMLAGHETSPAAIEVARAKLSLMHVGIAACDRFIGAVSAALTCEELPLDTRIQLGNETADFWSLPTSGLPADAQARMSATCGQSLQTLQDHVSSVGCMP